MNVVKKIDDFSKLFDTSFFRATILGTEKKNQIDV